MCNTDREVLSACAAAALEFLHARDLVHRDVKPENICFSVPVEASGEAFSSIRLIDFGAHLTRHRAQTSDG